MNTAPGEKLKTLESARLSEVHNPSSEVVHFASDAPLRLDCEQQLSPFSVAYKTYGELNEARSNAILICHALTGDQHVASPNPITGKAGWWENLVGPGKPVDTNRFFVICANIIGGCMGSTGPASINPATGEPYGLSFPVITIADMVRAQVRLIGLQPLRAGVLRDPDRHRVLSLIAKHCFPRSRSSGSHGRPRLVRRRLLRAGKGSAQWARRGTHGRTYHVLV